MYWLFQIVPSSYIFFLVYVLNFHWFPINFIPTKFPCISGGCYASYFSGKTGTKTESFSQSQASSSIITSISPFALYCKLLICMQGFLFSFNVAICVLHAIAFSLLRNLSLLTVKILTFVINLYAVTEPPFTCNLGSKQGISTFGDHLNPSSVILNLTPTLPSPTKFSLLAYFPFQYILL